MISDIWGRVYVLQFSILISTLGAALMAVIPGYEQLGILSPILLLICRFLISAGGAGEHATSMAFLVEHTSVFKRGKIISFAAAAEVAALFAVAAAVVIYKSITPELDLHNHWKLLFLLMIPLSIITMLARKYVFESLEFVTKNKYDLKRPFASFLPKLVSEIMDNRRLIIPMALLSGNCTFQLAFMRIPKMLVKEYNLSTLQQGFITLIMYALAVLAIIYLGAKSDKTGRIVAVRGYLLLLAVLWLPFFYFLENDLLIASIICVIIMIAASGRFACASALLIESISSSAARCSVFVLFAVLPIYNGLLPMLLNYLDEIQNGHFMLAALLTLVSLLAFFAVRRFDEPLDKCKGVGEYSLDRFQIA
jgi:MHS family proline/betaine transporter-like MFS transporter